MTSRRAPEPAKLELPPVEGMLQLDLRQHCLRYHRGLGFITRVEHAADHRLRDSVIDHVHVSPQQEGEADAANEGS